MNHLMIDIETLGVKELPAILSIGWCLFDSEILGSGEVFPVIEGNIDGETVMWWLKQSDEARLAQARAPRTKTLTECLESLSVFIKDSDISTVWCKGASFDFRILHQWFDELGGEPPWHYGQERCLRSFKEISQVKKSHVPHSAKHDAIAQAEQVISVWQAQ